MSSQARAHLGGNKPFGNPNSFVDTGDGRQYFYVSDLDATMVDVAENSVVSFTLSEAQIPGLCSEPEDPTCARLTFTGRMVNASASLVPKVKDAMFARHPEMKEWPSSHDFHFVTIDPVTSIWLVDFYGGATEIDPACYYNISVPWE